MVIMAKSEHVQLPFAIHTDKTGAWQDFSTIGREWKRYASQRRYTPNVLQCDRSREGILHILCRGGWVESRSVRLGAWLVSSLFTSYRDDSLLGESSRPGTVRAGRRLVSPLRSGL